MLLMCCCDDIILHVCDVLCYDMMCDVTGIDYDMILIWYDIDVLL